MVTGCPKIIRLVVASSNIYTLHAEAIGRTKLYELFRGAQVAQTGLAERTKELLSIAPRGGGVPPGDAQPETDVEPQDPPEGGLRLKTSPETTLSWTPRRLSSEPERGTPNLALDEGAAGPEEVPPDAEPLDEERPSRLGS